MNDKHVNVYEELMSCGHAKRYLYGKTPQDSSVQCALCDLFRRPASGVGETEREAFTVTIFADREFVNDWHVERINSKTGDIYDAVFSGPDAEQTARAYAAWQARSAGDAPPPRERDEVWARNLMREMALSENEGRVKLIADALAIRRVALYERVTATTARPEGAEWKPDSMQANAAPFLKEQVGNCKTPHFLGDPTPDRKALIQRPHYELPEGLCKDWRPVVDSGAITAEEEKA